MTGKVYFIGAGPGAPDLLTVRAERLIREADVVIYADSLVHPDVARLARADARVEASSRLTLEQMSDLSIESAREGKLVARLQSGDPSIYGAMFEQIVRLRAEGVPFEIVPGVSSAFAAAALLEAELTVPGVSQTIILTRTAGRTGPLPQGEDLRALAAHRSSMALFLSGALLRTAVPELIEGGYPPETSAALVYRATWEDERIVRGKLADMAELGHSAGLTKQVLLMVGDALDPDLISDVDRRSHLYDPSYSHGRRVARARTSTAASQVPHPNPLPGGERASSVEPVSYPPETRSLSPWERVGVRDPGTPSRRISIIAVSRPGATLAERIAKDLPGSHVELPTTEDGGTRGLIERLWQTSDHLILVMAAGAATRMIAPLLTNKRSDPGVVIVDDAGQFAISLLGGHRADTNTLAGRVAAAIGARAVTTTASDALGLPSVEALARTHGWTIENDGVAVTRLAAAIVNGETIGALSDSAVDTWWTGPDDQIVRLETIEALSEANVEAALIVTDRSIPRPYASNLDHWVIARPPTLVVGLGCSTGAPLQELETLMQQTLDNAGLSRLSVASLATIDRRSNEPAILELAQRLKCQIQSFTSDQLTSVLVPTPSQIVQEAVGTSSVCEAAALLASRADELLVTKQKNAVATVAIARLRTQSQ